MSHAPATGERTAARGYRWQYDHIAALVYDALYDSDFVALRLTDPLAGRVDDLVLVRHGRTDGYQFKSVEFDRALTFNQVVHDQRKGGSKRGPSLLRTIADGWNSLQSRQDNAHVHLVTQQFASVHDHLGQRGEADRPSPDHFSAFLKRVLRPLCSGEVALDEVGIGWQPALRKLREASGVPLGEFARFLRSLHFDVAAGSGLPTSSSTRQSDILALSDALFRLVSEASDVVELDERGVLDLMGWRGRTLLHSRHDFPVDLDTYAPLADAVAELTELIGRHRSGYLAVVGPPGTGKSTLLSRALMGSPDRVVRYHAYVPGTGLARTRLTARSFLHDMVLMLATGGLDTHERQLTSSEVQDLWRQLGEQLDAASEEFRRKGLRTIVVVDGLDHVVRYYSGADGLLAELPRPSELPEGVLFIVGSQTLTPLGAHAQQQIEERQAIVDLQHHPLSTASVLDICQRTPVARNLAPKLHQRIAERSSGHPLSLSYLLNRLRDADGEAADDVIEAAPPYEGDVAAEYRAVWDGVQDDDDIVNVLAVCSRLRIGFTTEWLASWARDTTVRAFWRKLRYLFRSDHDGWRFFHDSFRQFAADRTALGDDTRPSAHMDALAHQRVAELCAITDDPRTAAEQLYHRHHANQDDQALVLAKQEKFREQYQRLRSPHLIREDIGLALAIAADRADVLAMLRLLLALVETTERASALESVDMPGLLHEAGLTDEALAYCGGDTPRIPLAQAYDLAARLGAENNPAGGRLFNAIEHHGRVDRNRARVSGGENEAAVAWVRAASSYRPLTGVVASVQHVVQSRPESGREDRDTQADQWHLYERMMQALIDAVALRNDEQGLKTIDGALADYAGQLIEASSQSRGLGDAEGGDADQGRSVAIVTDLRVRSLAALLGLATTPEDAALGIDRLLSALSDGSLFSSTMLDAADLLAHHGTMDEAADLLDQTPYGKSLTVHALSYDGEAAALGSRFRYWRLRHLLASNDADVPESVPPPTDTPAGDDVAQGAPLHRDVDAIELAAGIDAAVWTLGRLDAAISSGQAASATDAWAALVPMLDLFRPAASHSSATLGGIAQQKPELMRVTVSVALRYGCGLPQRLSDELARRFKERPERWALRLRLDLAEQLESAGVSAPWHRDTLASCEASAVSRDVYLRLDDMADLVRRYARNDEKEAARHLVRRMIPIAFGVGYRKDYQFDSWVVLLGRALAGPSGSQFVEEAAWLARLLTAVEPMTEGAPGAAAAELSAVIVPADPVAAVRVFEYLVRHGTVQHTDALAALVRALVAHAGPDGVATVELAADIVGELLAPAANQAYPNLAASLLTAAEVAVGHAGAMALAESVASRTDSRSLRTARRGWRQGLGLATSVEENGDNAWSDEDYGALVLSEGRQIARTEVASHIRSVEDICALRSDEASDSTFSWVPVVDQQTLTSEDVLALADAFGDGSERSAEVLASLAEAAEQTGDSDTALRLAFDAFRTTPSNSWSRLFGGSRQRAAAITARLGGQDARVAACRDLARQATSSRWFPGLLHQDFEGIVEALDPGLDAATIWAEVRTYLDGIATELDLDDHDVLNDHGCRWWLPEPNGDQRAASDDSTPPVALAELAVGHLSHPTWLVGHAATTVVIRALVAGNEDVARALVRFAQPVASDDTLERAGRCLAAARAHEGYVVPASLQPLERTLASHPSHVIRDLAAHRPRTVSRALPPVYYLTLPTPAATPIGSQPALLLPYEDQYEILASGGPLDVDTLRGVAARYASEALAKLPEQEAVRSALRAARMRHAYLYEEHAASRAAFGRVLADIADAGLLDGAPPYIWRLLRTVDIELLRHGPQGRPNVLPAPPPGGHDQTAAQWQAEIEDRLEDYVAASTDQEKVLIGARSRLTVLGWGRLEEEFACGTTVGAVQPVEEGLLAYRRSMLLRDLVSAPEGRLPVRGDPLVVENSALTFHQIHSDWLAFRPDLAAALGWTPDSIRPGRWHTATGELATETILWVDGWLGRAGPVREATEATGYAVVLTMPGLVEVAAAFGDLYRHLRLTRRGQEDGRKTDPVPAVKSLPVVVPPSWISNSATDI